MAKEKNARMSPLMEFFQLGIYKRSQGRIARQVTFAAFAVGVLMAAWRLSVAATSWRLAFLGENGDHVLRFGMPGALGLVGIWIAFRVVNLPSFADFLIAVEAEMNKVSWPTRSELWRSSLVVILLILFMAAVLYGYDVFWRTLLNVLQIVQGGG